MRIAALTDIHALSGTFAQALAAARAEGFDIMLIMGDLLTYGVHPSETLDLAQDAVDRDGAVLLTGNHDLLYTRDVNASDYRTALPDWLRESVAWTEQRIPAGMIDSLPWRTDWAEGPLFAAHANPHAFGDWRYIRSQEDAREAAQALGARGYRFGLFGHTHRMRRYEADGTSVLTLSSLGQPRDDQDPRPQWAMLELDGDAVSISPRAVTFDAADHRKAINATDMSAATRERLCRFFA